MTKRLPLVLASGELQELPAADELTSRLVTVNECIYAGVATTTYSNGSTPTINGLVHTMTIDANGAISMVATGLKFASTSSSSVQERNATISGGQLASLLGTERMMRQRWQFWVHLASYNFASATVAQSHSRLWTSSPTYGVDVRRARNSGTGTPNTSAGGPYLRAWINGTGTDLPYAGDTSADVFMIDVIDPWTFNIYGGAWSSGWPSFENMTFLGKCRMDLSNSTAAANAIWNPANVDVMLGLLSTNVAEVIFDRWRLTAFSPAS